MNKTLVAVVVIIVLLVGGYYVYQNKGNVPTPATGEPVKVGVLLPLSGDAAIYGEPAANIYKLAVEEINSKGGINGSPIELVIEDAKCNGKDATSAAQKLINIDKVKVIIGGFCSGESIAAIPVAEAAKVALISSGSSSPDLTGMSEFFARNYPSDDSQGKVLAQAAIKAGLKKVAFIQEKTDYVVGLRKAFEEEFVKSGGTVSSEEFASGVTDFRSQLTKLKNQNAEGLFIAAQTPAAAERVIKQIGELKWKPKQIIVSDPVIGDMQTVTNNKEILEGAWGAEFGVSNNAKFKDLATNYKTKYGSDMPYASYAQTEYDVVYLVRDALLAVGYDGEKISAWFRTVKDWEGASGKITIGQDGDRVGGHILKVIKDGKVEIAQ